MKIILLKTNQLQNSFTFICLYVNINSIFVSTNQTSIMKKQEIEIFETHKDARGYRVDFVDQTGWGHTTHISTSELVEHIVDSYLNATTIQMQDGSLEDTFHDPESMLMDDPTYCIKSYLEEFWPC